MLEKDSHAKVQMRRKVRGLRTVERSILNDRRRNRAPQQPPETAHDGPTPTPTPTDETTTSPLTMPNASTTESPDASRVQAQDVVLEYATAIRGILNDDQGGPLDPPGLRMAEALGEIRSSLQRCMGSKKGVLVSAS